jgi:hypothetical protein
MNIVGTVRRCTATAILATAAIALGGAIPVAHATGMDDFLRQVRADGIAVGVPDSSVIEDAQEVCDLIEYQQSAYPYLSRYAGLGPRHSAKFIADSTSYFCPQYTPR